MKKYSLSSIGILFLFLFFSCKKDNDLPSSPHNPPPGDTSTMRVFRLSFTNIPAQPDVLADITAIVTVKNENDETVLAGKVVQVKSTQQYLTDTVQLKKGNYKISALLIKEGDTSVRFAAPVTGSIKAPLVTKPLSIEISLNEKTEKIFSVDLLPVSNSDIPQDFGYPAGSFGNRPNEPEMPVSKNIFLRTLIRVGDIVYDSVPVQLTLKSWDALDNMTLKFIPLPAGLQPLQLPADAVKYQLSVSKWGTYDELVLMKDQVQEHSVYILGGSIAAKKLKTVFEYKIAAGLSIPQTKTDYEYLPNGELKQRLVWAKREDGSNYVQRKDLFDYQSGNITQLRSYDENNSLLSSGSFTYNNEGRVTGMEEATAGNSTTGTVHYTALETSSGISQDYRIDVAYTHNPSFYSTTYSKTMRGGSVLFDLLATSHGNLEEGRYHYDFNINPYAHLRIPDLLLSCIPKHNKTMENKIRQNTYPEFEPFDFNYIYNTDGYPTELYVKYRSYQTKQEVFTIKTVFVY